MSEELERLSAAIELRSVAEHAYHAAREEMENYVNAENVRAKAEIARRARETYGANVTTLHEALLVAEGNLTALRLELSEKGIGLPVPLGTKLRYPERSRYGTIIGYTYGVIEIFGPESRRRRGNGRYSTARIPKIGHYVIRYLRKDGSPSTDFDNLWGSHAAGWRLPSGWEVLAAEPKSA